MRAVLHILLAGLVSFLNVLSRSIAVDHDPAVRVLLQYNEARTGLPGQLSPPRERCPALRWNAPLAAAAGSPGILPKTALRTSVGTRTPRGWPGDRARRFGYPATPAAENAFCGYVTPEYAIWVLDEQPGHRANLLDPNHREVGLGYCRASDGRGLCDPGFWKRPDLSARHH